MGAWHRDQTAKLPCKLQSETSFWEIHWRKQNHSVSISVLARKRAVGLCGFPVHHQYNGEHVGQSARSGYLNSRATKELGEGALVPC